MAIDLKQRDTPLMRKLIAAGVAPARARLLGDLVCGFRATLAESPLIRHLSSDVSLSVIALMLGEMLIVNADFFTKLSPGQDWVSTAQVLDLLAIAQQTDPAPPEPQNIRIVTVEELLQTMGDRQATDPLDDEAADLAERHGGTVQKAGNHDAQKN